MASEGAPSSRKTDGADLGYASKSGTDLGYASKSVSPEAKNGKYVSDSTESMETSPPIQITDKNQVRREEIYSSAKRWWRIVGLFSPKSHRNERWFRRTMRVSTRAMHHQHKNLLSICAMYQVGSTIDKHIIMKICN